MKAITVGMLIYLVLCAVLVFANSSYEDLKRHRNSRQRDADNPADIPASIDIHLETRDIKPPHSAPRTRHAA
jgi:hypothetical protein